MVTQAKPFLSAVVKIAFYQFPCYGFSNLALDTLVIWKKKEQNVLNSDHSLFISFPFKVPLT